MTTVKQMQVMLNALGYSVGRAGADGIAGRDTIAALQAFQRTAKIKPSGVFDRITATALVLAYRAENPHDASQLPDRLPIPWMQEAYRLLGTKEISGAKSNSVILGFADRLGGWIESFYKNDDVPWCGLFVGNCIATTLIKEPLPANPLGALNWSKFGIPLDAPRYGAIMVYSRPGAGNGHVNFYNGETKTHYRGIGGNQRNAVTDDALIEKGRLEAIRWPKTFPLDDKAGPLVISGPAGTVSFNEG